MKRRQLFFWKTTVNYGALAAPLKWVYMFTMLAGRLEVYTLLILVGRACFLRRRS